MNNLLNPKWLIAINTLPITVLFYLYISKFIIIKNLLNIDNIKLWKSFGISLGILGFLNLLYALYLILKKQKVSSIYGFIALITYISFIYLYGSNSNDIIPFSIPRWIIPGDMTLYVGTFLMPTLIYSLFILVSHFTSNSQDRNPWKSFSATLLIPLAWYLISQIILPLWKPVDANFSTHAVIIFIIIGTVAFLFFLIRGLYILASKKAKIWKNYQLAWKIPISLFFPLLGLALNNGLISSFLGNGIFGDFNNIWFYILTVVNGILICLPNLENKSYRLFLFFGRSISFSFTFYFFLVFLPFLPLSIIAIIAFGLGFLMLTPLLLFVLHINELSKDFSYLLSLISKTKIRFVSLLGILTIPVLVTLSYLKDKETLYETLEYIYTPDYSKSYNINRSSLQKTLEIVKQHKDRNGAPIFGSKVPYLSTYFNWLVLDNLTLSNKKINTIENVFSGSTSFNLRSENIVNDQVKISNISSESTYDTTQNAWKSWIKLEITNHNTRSGFSEYATSFDLPEGCWISDYYLYVGDKKEMGILAEKKSATWVFSQIRNTNRDPGILYYLSGNKIAFRVFPFAKNEIRKTGIEFLHKNPIEITIDGHTLALGKSIEDQNENFENENLIYISEQKKESLQQIKRKPYFHFLVDVSNGNENNYQIFASRIEQVMQKNKRLSVDAKISFVNSYTNTINFDSDWEQYFNSQFFAGGYYLDRAIKQTLFNSYKNNIDNYPVIVAVTDSIGKAILDKDFSNFKMAYPDLNVFFHIDENSDLQAHSLKSNPKKIQPYPIKSIASNSVYKFTTANNKIRYLANNKEASIILKEDILKRSNLELTKKDWSTGLSLHGKWIYQVFHPEKTDLDWINLVRGSFTSKIMTPLTSYLVVENESQKAMLKKKQEQILSSNKSLDLGEDTQRMSEPNLITLVLLLLVILGIKQGKNYII